MPARNRAARPNPTAAALLGLLHEGPRTGWDLAAAAQQRFGEFWSVTRSQVYRELASMAGRGLVEAGEPGPRDAKPFRVTPAGREAFADWLAREPGPDSVRMPLLLTVAFSAHLEQERLREVLARQRQAHAQQLAGYRIDREALHAVPDVDPARLATLEFGIRYERAVLDWFEELDGLLGLGPARTP